MVKNKVLEAYPRRNYSNVVDVREFVFHTDINNFVWEVQQKHIFLLKNTREIVLDELANTQGFINNIHAKSETINEYRYRQGVLNHNENIKALARDLEKIRNKPYYKEMEYDGESN